MQASSTSLGDLGAIEEEDLQVAQALQMRQAGVGDLRVEDAQIDEPGEWPDVSQALVGDANGEKEVPKAGERLMVSETSNRPCPL
jgi:hypothetical protein